MGKALSRRSFLRKGALLGLSPILIPRNLQSLTAGNTGKVDIAAVRGADYFKNTVEAVKIAGGMKQFISKDATVGILINSAFRNPGTITHPDIPMAVIHMCIEAGAKHVISLRNEAPSYWQKGKAWNRMEGEIKILKPAAGHVKKKIPGGRHLKEAEIRRDLLDCDVLINIPIVKDHTGTGFTGNLKNMMGACTHATCRFFHYGSNPNAKGGYEDIDFLSQCIADLNLIRKPDLFVVDATRFVTTNGPFGPGELKRMDTVVAGTDPVAVDSHCASFLGLKGEDVVMIQKARQHRLGESNTDTLSIKTVSI